MTSMDECIYPEVGQLTATGYVTRGGRPLHRKVLEEKIGRRLTVGELAGHVCHDLAAAAGACMGGPACLHRRCVNPDHLAVQTIQENSVASPARKHAQQQRDGDRSGGSPEPDLAAAVYTYAEVGALTGVPVTTLRVWLQRGKLPDPDVRRRPPLWKPETIRRWAQDN